MYDSDFYRVYRQVARYVSPEVLKGVDVETVLRYSEERADFPHSEFHTRQVALESHYAGQMIGLSRRDLITLQVGAIIHDKGYKLSADGHWDLEHQEASLLLGLFSVNEEADLNWKALAESVALHTLDVLPEDASLITRILRDTDRAVRASASGIVCDAYYLGFQDSAFVERSETQIIEDGIVCDVRFPLEPDYEERVTKFVYGRVFPYIIENRLVKEMLNRMEVHFNRVLGKQRQSGSWEIEPVMDEVFELSQLRLANYYKIFTELLTELPRVTPD